MARRAVIDSPADFSSLTLLASGPLAIPEHRRPELHALRAALPETDLSTVWEARQEWERRNGAEPLSPAVAAFLKTRWLANHPLALTGKALILLEESDQDRATGEYRSALRGSLWHRRRRLVPGPTIRDGTGAGGAGGPHRPRRAFAGGRSAAGDGGGPDRNLAATRGSKNPAGVGITRS